MRQEKVSKTTTEPSDAWPSATDRLTARTGPGSPLGRAAALPLRRVVEFTSRGVFSTCPGT